MATSIVTDRMAADGWNLEGCDVQAWLERAPWRTLKGTTYGVAESDLPPHPALSEDVLLSRIYKLDIATFLTAERVSYRNIPRLVEHAPDEASQIFLITQASDEARHYEVFCNCLSELGLTPADRDELMASVTTRELKKFYDLIDEQVDKGDFAGAMLAHNIVLEGMAYPIYRYESAYWSVFAPRLTRLIKGAFADEVHHVRYGERIIARFAKMGEDSKNRMQRLTAEFHLLLTEVFESMISHYIHLYQLVANQYAELMGNVEIFPGRTVSMLDEETQVRILLQEIRAEHERRLGRIGL